LNVKIAIVFQFAHKNKNKNKIKIDEKKNETKIAQLRGREMANKQYFRVFVNINFRQRFKKRVD
jgi:hypothetical protein